MGSSVNSDALRSSGGWMNSTLDETEKAEEELKRELKKAKVMAHYVYLLSNNVGTPT
jgi:hypothetical protein